MAVGRHQRPGAITRPCYRGQAPTEVDMSSETSNESGPDLAQGVPIESLGEAGLLSGHVGKDAVLIARLGDEFFAIDAACTHYHGPLAEGLIVGGTVRCPWHHACFSLRTGEAVRAPALDPVPCWRVERIGDKAFVREKLAGPMPRSSSPTEGSPGAPTSVVIVGGGAAGLASADMFVREGYQGAVTM